MRLLGSGGLVDGIGRGSEEFLERVDGGKRSRLRASGEEVEVKGP